MAKEALGTDDQAEAILPVGKGAARPEVVSGLSAAFREHGATLGLKAEDFHRVSPGTGPNGQSLERRSTFGE